VTPIISGHSFSFDSGVAMHCGMNAAVVFNYICNWIHFNYKNLDERPEAEKDEKIWMYETQEKMSRKIGFLSTKEVKNAIAILVEKGLLIKENFNRNRFNQTNWYTLPDELFQKMFPIVPKRTIDENHVEISCQNELKKSLRKSQPGPSESPEKDHQYKEETSLKTSSNKTNIKDVLGVVDTVHNQKPSENSQGKSKDVHNSFSQKDENLPPQRQKFRNRPVPDYLKRKAISEKDQKLLANQFTDSEICRAMEDAMSYKKKIGHINNLAAFLTKRCQEYAQKAADSS
jgi:hypothetical protein